MYYYYFTVPKCHLPELQGILTLWEPYITSDSIFKFKGSRFLKSCDGSMTVRTLARLGSNHFLHCSLCLCTASRVCMCTGVSSMSSCLAWNDLDTMNSVCTCTPQLALTNILTPPCIMALVSSSTWISVNSALDCLLCIDTFQRRVDMIINFLPDLLVIKTALKLICLHCSLLQACRKEFGGGAAQDGSKWCGMPRGIAA